jgi:hypothetical protein
LTVSAGKTWARKEQGLETLFITRTNQVTIGKPPAEIFNAVSGRGIIVRESKAAEEFDKKWIPPTRNRVPQSPLMPRVSDYS